MTAEGFIAVIPARYASTRLPGKPLKDIAGKPMIEWVYRQTLKSGANEVIVATDDERIAAACHAFGAPVEMTSTEHSSGTDRIAELARRFEWDDQQIVVNVQGDEPLI
ncbi:MAG TPA: NTP transferase domain-containing protein, partial [Gammaproteobacteria bacterium]|nr:NTP transferase domain-containing protein [Gammaproteobacteria bacterium]